VDSEEHVALNTRLLRSDTEPFWERLRGCLREKGVEPSRSILTTCFPDDSSFEFGIVISPDRQVYEFGFEYLHKQVTEGVLREWNRTTDRWRDRPFAGEVAAGFAQLDAESQ
jgi:hypothetical protein